MRTLKNSVAATLVTVLLTGFALGADKQKGKRKGKGKGKNKAPAAKVESAAGELDPLTKSLGFSEKDLKLFAESLGAENGGELAEMGAQLLGQFLSTPEGREAGKALAETGAQLFGQMMSGEGGGDSGIDLGGLLGGGGADLSKLLEGLGGEFESNVQMSGKAIIIRPDGKKREIELGKGGDLPKDLPWRRGQPHPAEHDDDDHDHDHHDAGEEDEDNEDGEDVIVETLEEIAEQMKRQNELLTEILERLDD